MQSTLNLGKKTKMFCIKLCRYVRKSKKLPKLNNVFKIKSGQRINRASTVLYCMYRRELFAVHVSWLALIWWRPLTSSSSARSPLKSAGCSSSAPLW